MSRPVRLLVVFASALVVTGCGLFTSLDGLSDPAATDAGTAATTDASEAGSPAVTPATCACPTGTAETNGVCVVTTPAAGNACNAPIVAPACPLVYEAELCAAHTAFAYATSCGGKPRPSVFFVLGPLSGSVPDGGERRWVVKSQNTEVLARTNAACTQAVEPCAEGTAPRGELSPGGATVAFGKTVTSGCQTVRVDIAPY